MLDITCMYINEHLPIQMDPTASKEPHDSPNNHKHCTDTAPASSPFLTLLGGAFLSFGPEVFTFCVGSIY